MNLVIDKLLTNYEIIGLNNRKNIVILHGWKNDISSWKKTAGYLSDAGFKVILLDLPGFGMSNKPENIWGVDDYANFVKSFINKINLKNYTLLGHSLGGKIAANLSLKDSRIQKLILVAPSGIEVNNIFIKSKMILFNILKILLFFLPETVKKKIAYLFGSRDYKIAGELLDIFKKVVNVKLEPFASKIKVPTIIIWGDKDSEVSVLGAKKLNKLIKKSKIRILWGGGHLLQIESPEKLSTLILESL